MSQSNHMIEDSSWPLAPSQRVWGTWELFVVLLVAAAATWCYVIGEYVGYYLQLKAGFASMTAGAMIGMLMVTLAVVPPSTKYGIDSIVSAKAQFGANGWLITVVLQYVSIICWNSILLIFFGKALEEFLVTIGVITADSATVAIVVGTLAACAFVFISLMRGTAGVKRVSNILFFFIVGVGAWIIYELVTGKSAELAAAVPAYASGDLQWDYVTGIEIGIVSLLSWWPYIGAMTRVARNTRTATVPAMIGMGLPVPLLSTIGLAAILALGTSNPAQWLTELGGSFYGAIALLFVIAANIGTAVAGLYASAVGLRAVPALSTAPWALLLALAILPVMAIGIFIPDLFFSNIGTVLAYMGVFFAPLCAIQIVDYYLLRKQRLNVRGLFQRSADSPYAYWGGFNPAAILGMLAGFATYLYLLNPVSYVSSSPYEILTASLPTAVVGAVVYLVVTFVVVKPAGKGDYH
ncbi:MAG: cytosine permease [Rhodospirillaceae bacterium]|nr:cytosine permease [Rhodospirillaceae bacterium]